MLNETDAVGVHPLVTSGQHLVARMHGTERYPGLGRGEVGCQ